MRVKYFLIIIPLIFSIHVAHAAPASHVVISEVKISGLTGFSTDEFVELYNPTDSPVDITGWQMIKRTASGAAYPLVESFDSATVTARGYFLIAHPSGYAGAVAPDARYSTSNSLSTDNSVELVGPLGVVDVVGWGKAMHFEGTVAPTPGSAKSIERKALPSSTTADMMDGGSDVFRGNGEDTDHNDADFVSRDIADPQSSASDLEFITAQAPKPKVTNTNQSLSTPTLATAPTTPAPAQPVPHTVALSEILPDPKGPDTTEEYIELVNTGDVAVDLTNWKLNDSSKTGYCIPKGTIVPGGWFVVKRGESGIALNNTGGESVTLTAPDGVVTSTLSWEGTVPEAQSYSLVKGAWVWTAKLTPGAANVFLDTNHAPVANIGDVDTNVHVRDSVKLSATDSTDPDGDDLDFSWTFGDGGVGSGTNVKHAFMKAGTFTVVLTATDPKGKSGTAKVTFTVQDYQRSTDVVISTIVPNPADGEDEYVELVNTGLKNVDLAGWSLVIGAKQQMLDGVIATKGKLHLAGEDLRLALRNAGATIELKDPDGKSVSAVTWATTPRGSAIIRQADGTYSTGTEATEADALGKVEGASVVVAQPATVLGEVQPKKSGAVPWWIWLVILGVCGATWGGWALFQSHHVKKNAIQK